MIARDLGIAAEACDLSSEVSQSKSLQDRKVSAVIQEDDREILLPLPPISKELEAGFCCQATKDNRFGATAQARVSTNRILWAATLHGGKVSTGE